MARPGFETRRTGRRLSSAPRRASARSGASADIFEQVARQRRGGPRFVFYEGPPTANGMPHNGHVLTRVMKDVFPRYQVDARLRRAPPGRLGHARAPGRDRGREGAPHLGARRDRRLRRRALRAPLPRERLPLHRGVEGAHREARLLARPRRRLRHLPPELRRERVVGALAAASSTACSTGATRWCGGGRRAAPCSRPPRSARATRRSTIPRCYVRLPLADEPGTSLLAWTTTPWTLPSNGFAAVQPDVDYAVVRDGEQRLIVAEPALRAALAEKVGRELPGRADAARRPSWSAGATRRPSTGSPRSAAGRDSLARGRRGLRRARRRHRHRPRRARLRRGRLRAAAARAADAIPTLPLLCAVRPDGSFDPDARARPPTPGRWVKDADRDLCRELKERGLVWHARADPPRVPVLRALGPGSADPVRAAGLVHPHHRARRARRSPTTRAIHWLPEHIRDGRFGDFLRNNVDWALSRERFWGTPLNVWINDETGRDRGAGVGRRDPRAQPARLRRLRRGAPAGSRRSRRTCACTSRGSTQVTWTRPGEPGVYRRVPEVIDAWFDSGSMPFAQWGYPHRGSRASSSASFPADFISRGDRPDARLVQLAALDLDAALPRARAAAPVQDLRRARPRRRPRGQEGVEEQGQLHAARDHPRPRAARVRRGGARGRAARARRSA